MAVSLRELWLARDGSAGGRAERGGERGASRSSDPAPEPRSRREVVAQIRAGDEAAFDALFRQQFPRLVGFATALVGSHDVASDVVSEVFTRIWCRHAEWDPAGDVGAYLFRAVRNQAANVRRAGRRAETFRQSVAVADDAPGIGRTPGAEAAMEHDAALATLWRAVDALPDARRAVAYLRWREGMDYDDIAEITGQSASAVKMQVSRTLSALRRVIPELID